jgi:DNA-binding GntR family transcriptional regulator
MSETKTKPAIQDSGESILRRQLKDAIVSQKLAPGQKVTETGLAELLSTSRTVARGLMKQLTVQGFLVSISPRMTRVAPLTVTSIKENFMLRKMILPELIATSITSVDTDALSALNKAIETLNVDKDDDDQVLELLRLNRQFNLMMFADSKYQLPVSWAKLLDDMAMRIYWIYVKQHGKLPFAATQHENYIKAMQEDDPKRVQAIVRKTLTQNEDRILSAVLSSDHFHSHDLIV